MPNIIQIGQLSKKKMIIIISLNELLISAPIGLLDGPKLAYITQNNLISSFYINIFNQQIMFKSRRLKPIYYLTALLATLISVGISITFNAPARLGMITITHQRNENNQFFKQYLKRNAQGDCDAISEISIVWNNPYSVQKTVTQQMRDNWKRPVYFYPTEFNSFSFRYRLANQSRANVFLSLDDDISINCNALKNAFQIWRESAVGDNGPLLGLFNAGVLFSIQNDYFLQTGANYYSQIQMGGAIISRKMIDLYNSYMIEPFQANSIVRQVNNCDDMATNFIALKFFPQLQPIFINGVSGYLQVPPKAASSANNFHSVRNQCNKNFSKIFGHLLQPFSEKQINKIKDQWKMPRELYENIINLVSMPVEYQMHLQKFVKLQNISQEGINQFLKKIEYVASKPKKIESEVINFQNIQEDKVKLFAYNIQAVKSVLQQQWDNYILISCFGGLLMLNLTAIFLLVVFVQRCLKKKM